MEEQEEEDEDEDEGEDEDEDEDGDEEKVTKPTWDRQTTKATSRQTPYRSSKQKKRSDVPTAVSMERGVGEEKSDRMNRSPSKIELLEK